MSDTELPGKHVYTSCIPVRWGDMDAFGHVNNTVYFRYMEQVRIEWMVSLMDMADSHGIAPVLVSTQCDFLQSLKYPDKIEVQMFIGSPGRSSFDTFYKIYRLDEERTLCAEGSGKVVWVNHVTGKSTPLPEIVLKQFSMEK